MNAIDATFERLRGAGARAFLPFLVAGDPSPEVTVEAARTLAAAGANLIEIGFPYSDPIADGPVIQAAYTRALGRGLRLDGMLDCVRRIAETPEVRGKVPLLGMVAYSLIHRRGPERFLAQAQEAGLIGLIVPDLPLEEARAFAPLAASRQMKLVLLVTPTTPPERARAIATESTGFLYCVSVAGITGERAQIPDELIRQLAGLRQETALPLCVGFGISKTVHAQALRAHADGIIVGSAIVRLLEGERPLTEKLADIRQLATDLVTALQAAS